MTNEAQERQEIVRIARTWIKTPYHPSGAIKGAGVDCLMILVAVFQEVGLIPKEFDPRPYSDQWHVHNAEEKYLNGIVQFTKEVEGPPSRMTKSGDIVLFKLGLVSAHGAIVTDWPWCVHARADVKMVVEEDISRNSIGKRALWRLEKRFFSYWEK